MSTTISKLDQASELRVLVVEDNADALRLIERMLASIGYDRILTAGGGKEALEILEPGKARDRIDVVLCDWNMPDISGFDVLDRVRAFAPNLPFILITGEATEDAVEEAIRRGATSHLLKPFSKHLLANKMTVIERILEARAA